MCPLPNSTGSNSGGETSSQAGSSQKSFDKQFFKDLIKRADSVPLVTLLKHYGIKLDPQNRKITCPFPKHKNGRESTPSFWYYPDTNTFWCFGCKTGVGGSDFVSNIEGITRVRAAFKIIEMYSSEISVDDIEMKQGINYSERLEILMDFSDFVRQFVQTNLDDSSAISYIEKISFIFDKMNEKHSLDNNALKVLSEKLKIKVNQYKPCPQL